MWLLLAVFIVIKLMVLHQLQNIQHDVHHNKICPQNYVGYNADPFDCNAYFVCPEKIKLYCPSNTQFDLDTLSCVPMSTSLGCTGRLYRNLLL